MTLFKRLTASVIIAGLSAGFINAQDPGPPLTLEEARARAAAAEARAKAKAAEAKRAEAEALAAMAAAEAAKLRVLEAAAKAAGKTGKEENPGIIKPARKVGVEDAPPARKPDPEYVVKSGDLPSAIADKVYGNPSYHRVITTYNYTSEKGLKVGEVLKVPDFRTMMEKEKIVPLMEAEVAALLEALELFKTVETKLRELGKSSPGKVDAIPKDVMEKLTKIETLLRQVGKGFETRKEGVQAVPASLVKQIKSAATKVAAMKTAQYGNNGYDVGRVHMCASFAMMYAMIWSRDGYK